MSWVTSRLRLGRCPPTRLYGNSAVSLCKVDKPSATRSTPPKLVARGVNCTSSKTLLVFSSISTQMCMLSQTAAVGVGRAWWGSAGGGERLRSLFRSAAVRARPGICLSPVPSIHVTWRRCASAEHHIPVCTHSLSKNADRTQAKDCKQHKSAVLTEHITTAFQHSISDRRR